MAVIWPMLFAQEPSEAIRQASQASSRRTDPETSQKAAQAVSPGVPAMNRAILSVCSRTIPHSAFAIANMVEHGNAGRWDEGSIRTRVSTLGKTGELVKAPDPHTSPRGRDCDAWLLP